MLLQRRRSSSASAHIRDARPKCRDVHTRFGEDRPLDASSTRNAAAAAAALRRRPIRLRVERMRRWGRQEASRRCAMAVLGEIADCTAPDIPDHLSDLEPPDGDHYEEDWDHIWKDKTGGKIVDVGAVAGVGELAGLVVPSVGLLRFWL